MPELLLEKNSIATIDEQLEVQARQLTFNAVTGCSDARTLFATAIDFAENLGYRDNIPAEISTGPNYGVVYLPGLVDYSPEDHVRGITSTIVESALNPDAKARLIVRAVNATHVTKPSKLERIIDGTTALPRSGIRERAARRAAFEEARNIRRILVKQNSQELDGMFTELESVWYPNHAKKQIAAVGLALGGIFAISRLRSRS